jgi:hypothetical protein
MEEPTNQLELVESQQALRLVPTWEPQVWWFLAAAGGVLLLGLLVVLLRKKKTPLSVQDLKKQAYAATKTELSALCSEDARCTAIEVSVILRRYLARTMSEPALFETHEEFVSRHDALAHFPTELREEIAALFSALAQIKYAPQDSLPQESGRTQATSLALLERMFQA